MSAGVGAGTEIVPVLDDEVERTVVLGSGESQATGEADILITISISEGTIIEEDLILARGHEELGGLEGTGVGVEVTGGSDLEGLRNGAGGALDGDGLALDRNDGSVEGEGEGGSERNVGGGSRGVGGGEGDLDGLDTGGEGGFVDLRNAVAEVEGVASSIGDGALGDADGAGLTSGEETGVEGQTQVDGLHGDGGLGVAGGSELLDHLTALDGVGEGVREGDGVVEEEDEVGGLVGVPDALLEGEVAVEVIAGDAEDEGAGGEAVEAEDVAGEDAVVDLGGDVGLVEGTDGAVVAEVEGAGALGRKGKVGDGDAEGEHVGRDHRGGELDSHFLAAALEHGEGGLGVVVDIDLAVEGEGEDGLAGDVDEAGLHADDLEEVGVVVAGHEHGGHGRVVVHVGLLDGVGVADGAVEDVGGVGVEVVEGVGDGDVVADGLELAGEDVVGDAALEGGEGVGVGLEELLAEDLTGDLGGDGERDAVDVLLLGKLDADAVALVEGGSSEAGGVGVLDAVEGAGEVVDAAGGQAVEDAGHGAVAEGQLEGGGALEGAAAGDGDGGGEGDGGEGGLGGDGGDGVVVEGAIDGGSDGVGEGGGVLVVGAHGGDGDDVLAVDDLNALGEAVGGEGDEALEADDGLADDVVGDGAVGVGDGGRVPEELHDMAADEAALEVLDGSVDDVLVLGEGEGVHVVGGHVALKVVDGVDGEAGEEGVLVLQDEVAVGVAAGGEVDEGHGGHGDVLVVGALDGEGGEDGGGHGVQQGDVEVDADLALVAGNGETGVHEDIEEDLGSVGGDVEGVGGGPGGAVADAVPGNDENVEGGHVGVREGGEGGLCSEDADGGMHGGLEGEDVLDDGRAALVLGGDKGDGDLAGVGGVLSDGDGLDGGRGDDSSGDGVGVGGVGDLLAVGGGPAGGDGDGVGSVVEELVGGEVEEDGVGVLLGREDEVVDLTLPGDGGLAAVEGGGVEGHVVGVDTDGGSSGDVLGAVVGVELGVQREGSTAVVEALREGLPGTVGGTETGVGTGVADLLGTLTGDALEGGGAGPLALLGTEVLGADALLLLPLAVRVTVAGEGAGVAGLAALLADGHGGGAGVAVLLRTEVALALVGDLAPGAVEVALAEVLAGVADGAGKDLAAAGDHGGPLALDGAHDSLTEGGAHEAAGLGVGGVLAGQGDVAALADAAGSGDALAHGDAGALVEAVGAAGGGVDGAPAVLGAGAHSLAGEVLAAGGAHGLGVGGEGPGAVGGGGAGAAVDGDLGPGAVLEAGSGEGALVGAVEGDGGVAGRDGPDAVDVAGAAVGDEVGELAVVAGLVALALVAGLADHEVERVEDAALEAVAVVVLDGLPAADLVADAGDVAGVAVVEVGEAGLSLGPDVLGDAGALGGVDGLPEAVEVAEAGGEAGAGAVDLLGDAGSGLLPGALGGAAAGGAIGLVEGAGGRVAVVGSLAEGAGHGVGGADLSENVGVGDLALAVGVGDLAPLAVVVADAGHLAAVAAATGEGSAGSGLGPDAVLGADDDH